MHELSVRHRHEEAKHEPEVYHEQRRHDGGAAQDKQQQSSHARHEQHQDERHVQTALRGVFELERRYAAPKTLQFVPVQFSGDGFVKHNVINRLLQQEVDRTEKQDGAQTAITERNYKFTYKGESEIDGRSVHVYSVKPRTNVPGLFKGHVYLDVLTGAMLRAEGKLEQRGEDGS